MMISKYNRSLRLANFLLGLHIFFLLFSPFRLIRIFRIARLALDFIVFGFVEKSTKVDFFRTFTTIPPIMICSISSRIWTWPEFCPFASKAILKIWTQSELALEPISRHTPKTSRKSSSFYDSYIFGAIFM